MDCIAGTQPRAGNGVRNVRAFGRAENDAADEKSQRDGRFDAKATVDAMEKAADEELGPLEESEDDKRLEKLGF